MAEGLRGEIERLLAEGREPRETKVARWRRARLTADLSQALGDAGAGETHGLSDDLAAKAAFLDDGQVGPDREEFAAALANDEKLRADVESALALIEAVGGAPAPVPKQLLRQAQAQFSPTPGSRPAGNRPRLLWS
jgi:hypothetical protein